MNYDEFKKLVLDNLNDNPYGVIFDLDVFNSDEYEYEKEYDIVGSDYGTEIKRVVPTMIGAPYGDVLSVPNTYAIDGSMNIVFDIFIDDETKFINQSDEDKFKSVNYINTLSAIQEFSRKLLVKSNPLGDVSLFFGGNDSSAIGTGNSTGYDTIYLKLDIQDFYNENILKASLSTDEVLSLDRTKAGNFVFTIADDATVLTVPYSLGLQEIVLKVTPDGFSINNESHTVNIAMFNIDNISLGTVTGLNAKVYDIRIGETSLTYETLSSVDDYSYSIMFNDFIDNVLVESNGIVPNWELNVSNAVLWGKEGNVMFGFTNLIPDDGIDISKGYRYQLFSMSVPFMYTTDVLFGSNFRYYLNLNPDIDGNFSDEDDIEVFAIDRQHTIAGEDTTFQPINSNYSRGLNTESMKGLTKTFLYKPERALTQLLKRIMTSDIPQNQKYRIKVQAPFFSTTYNCYINNGGNGTEFYSYSTFTVEFKEIIE